MDIAFRKRPELYIWNVRDGSLTLEYCRKVFKNPDIVLYIEDEDNHLSGMVTLGTVCRNIAKPDKWISYKFIKIITSNGQEQDAERLFLANANINMLPVVSKEGEILGEYCRLNKTESICPVKHADENKIERFLVYIREHYADAVWMDSALEYIYTKCSEKSLKVCMTYESLFNEIKQMKSPGIIIEGETENFKQWRLEVVTRFLGSKYKTLEQIWSDFEQYDNVMFTRWGKIKNKNRVFDEIFNELNISKVYCDGLTASEKNICNAIGQQVNDTEWCWGIPERWTNNEILIYGTNYTYQKPEGKSGLLQRGITWLVEALEYSTEESLALVANMLAELKKKEEIEVFYAEIPGISEVYLTSYDKERLKDKNLIENIWQNPEKYKTLLIDFFGINYDKEFFESLWTNTKTVNWRGYRKPIDFSDLYKTIINGRRVTDFQPEVYQNTVWLVGACTVFGHYVTDEQTISSQMQKVIADINASFRVVNCGVPSMRLTEMYEIIQDIEYKEGDILIIIYSPRRKAEEILKELGIEFISLSTLFQQEDKEGVWFLDSTSHINYRASFKIARYVVEELNKRQVFLRIKSDSGQIQKKRSTEKKTLCEEREKIGRYINEVKNEMICQGFAGGNQYKTGAIVMNCNPLTNGHLYLIETAAKSVEILIVFVVQEDKSFFSFQDRFHLVKEATASIHNVVVVPSGEFVLSVQTFPGYFQKESLNLEEESRIDSSIDITLFADAICPALGISKRFVGEEPYDRVTNQYNQCMKDILPMRGIEVIEIKRKEYSQRPISASYVRQLIHEKRFEDIEEIVPKCTMKYIKERFVK